MKIVIDTNVVISGVFFGGFPRKVIEAAARQDCIACALDAGAYYIVSGDKDLLELQNYRGVQMITAAEFCQKFLQDE